MITSGDMTASAKTGGRPLLATSNRPEERAISENADSSSVAEPVPSSPAVPLAGPTVLLSLPVEDVDGSVVVDAAPAVVVEDDGSPEEVDVVVVVGELVSVGD